MVLYSKGLHYAFSAVRMVNQLELKTSEFKELFTQLCVGAWTEGLFSSVDHHCVLAWSKAKNVTILQKMTEGSKGLTYYLQLQGTKVT